MQKWSAGEEHERAVTLYQAYAVLAAKVRSLQADRTLPAAAMHPHPGQTGFGAIAHYARGFSRLGHDQSGLNRRVYLLQMGKTAPVFQFTRGWIYRNDVVAAPRHFAEDNTAEILRITREADQGDAPLRQEVPNIIQSRRHEMHLLPNSLVEKIPSLPATIGSDGGHMVKCATDLPLLQVKREAPSEAFAPERCRAQVNTLNGGELLN